MHPWGAFIVHPNPEIFTYTSILKCFHYFFLQQSQSFRSCVEVFDPNEGDLGGGVQGDRYGFIFTLICRYPFPQHHWLNRGSFIHCMFLASLFKKNGGYSPVGLYLVPLFCFTDLWSIFVMMALQCILTSGMIITPGAIFLPRIALAIQDLLYFHMDFEIVIFYLCEEWHWNFDGNCIGSMCMMFLILYQF